jgi:hypothetical protein
MGGWVGSRASLNDMEKRKFLTLLGLELQPLGHPACSQLLYRLRHPGSHFLPQAVDEIKSCPSSLSNIQFE